jgi:hypothetical protein
VVAAASLLPPPPQPARAANAPTTKTARRGRPAGRVEGRGARVQVTLPSSARLTRP